MNTIKQDPFIVADWIVALVVALVVAACAGCASVSQSMTERSVDTNGVVTLRETRSNVRAIGDAKNSVEKIRVSHGKTQSIGVSGSEQEASTPIKDLTELLKAVRPTP
jgi:ABC-type Zn uptake system ZnuABC Zn-binding protein ZnuA